MVNVLNGYLRDDKNPRQLRAENKIPAELYGPDVKNQSVSLDYSEFMKVYNEAGESSLVTLKAPDGKSYNVLIVAAQLHHISGKFIHVDLRQVSMTEKIEAEANLAFVGEAPAVKELGGTFMATRDTLKIKALPKDLINEIEVDISTLATFNDKISVGDIKLPEGVEAAEEKEVVIASVIEPREEEEAPVSEEAEKQAVENVEVEGGANEGSAETKEESEK